MKNSTANPSEVPIFFILGRGRSGSTLLRTMLDAHPEIAIPNESRFVQYLSYKYGKRKQWPSEVLESFYQDLLQCYESPEVDCELLHDRMLSMKTPITFAQLCKQVYLSVKSPFAKESIHCIGDKNPRYVFFIKKLVGLFPEAKFIHITRDYRDSTLSFYNVRGMDFEKKNAAFLAFRWKYYNQQVLKFKTQFPEKCYTLKYEDLVVDSEGKLREICNFAGIEYHCNMLDYRQRINEVFEASSEAFQGIHSSLRNPVSDSKVERWKELMSENDVKTSDVIVGSLAEKLGYQRKYYRTFPAVYLKNWFYLLIAAVPLYSKKVFYGQSQLMRLFYWTKKESPDSSKKSL